MSIEAFKVYKEKFKRGMFGVVFNETEQSISTEAGMITYNPEIDEHFKDVPEVLFGLTRETKMANRLYVYFMLEKKQYCLMFLEQNFMIEISMINDEGAHCGPILQEVSYQDCKKIIEILNQYQSFLKKQNKYRLPIMTNEEVFLNGFYLNAIELKIKKLEKEKMK